MTSFGALLRSYRMAHGRTLRWLAGRVDMDHTYLARIEQGRLAAPHTATLYRLCQALYLGDDDMIALYQAAGLTRLPTELVNRTLWHNVELALLVRRLNGRTLSEQDAAVVRTLAACQD